MSASATWFLDTSVLLNVLKKSALGQHLVGPLQLRARSSIPMISVVSQGELFAIARRRNWGEPKLARLEELLNELVIVDIVASARPLIECYAELDAVSHSQGSKMGKNDLWIAASAAITNSVLLTCDRDFDRLHPDRLKVWWLDPAASSWPEHPPV